MKKRVSFCRIMISMLLAVMLTFQMVAGKIVKPVHAVSMVQSSEVGLAVNVFCTDKEGAANNVSLHWDTTLEAQYYVLYRSLNEKTGFYFLRKLLKSDLSG